jgi:hypothetical protein
MKMCQIELLAGEKQGKESNNATLACNDWLRLGPGRSIPKLLDYYANKLKIVKSFSAPSTSDKTLYNWSCTFGWSARAVQFDAEYEQRTNAARESEIAYGLALDYERIRKLKDLAELLEDQLYARDANGSLISLWVPDVKVVGHGDSAETVDIERFNSSIVQQYRETLNDLAKEVGGRVQKQEVAGTEPDGAMKVIVEYVERPNDNAQ